MLKKYCKKTVNPSIQIYVNEIDNTVTLKIKAGYYHEPLTPETIKLLGSTASKIAKNENGENTSKLVGLY